MLTRILLITLFLAITNSSFAQVRVPVTPFEVSPGFERYATCQAKGKIEVVSTPDRCDLEIDGVYKGSTPITIELTQGVVVKIRLTKAGYLPWEKAVEPLPGMRISAELEKKPN